MIFIKKKRELNGRPYIDFKKLNDITVKNKYLIPRQDII